MLHAANMKIIPRTIQRMRSSKGYTLLFAVIVSVLVLSIATFILSVSRKQAVLASSARDSIYAFYAADSGLECAIENIALLAASSSGTININCGGKTITAIQNPPDTIGPGGLNAVSATSTFFMLTGTGSSLGTGGTQNTQSGAASCASTSVSYVYTPGTLLVATSTVVTVETRGYNIGWKPTVPNGSNGDCSVTGPRKVERALRYTQTQ